MNFGESFFLISFYVVIHLHLLYIEFKKIFFLQKSEKLLVFKKIQNFFWVFPKLKKYWVFTKKKYIFKTVLNFLKLFGTETSLNVTLCDFLEYFLPSLWHHLFYLGQCHSHGGIEQVFAIATHRHFQTKIIPT